MSNERERVGERERGNESDVMSNEKERVGERERESERCVEQ